MNTAIHVVIKYLLLIQGCINMLITPLGSVHAIIYHYIQHKNIFPIIKKMHTKCIYNLQNKSTNTWIHLGLHIDAVFYRYKILQTCPSQHILEFHSTGSGIRSFRNDCSPAQSLPALSLVSGPLKDVRDCAVMECVHHCCGPHPHTQAAGWTRIHAHCPWSWRSFRASIACR